MIADDPSNKDNQSGSAATLRYIFETCENFEDKTITGHDGV